jgi:phosphoribosylaminoimidazole-succinocarboxamide synthase
LGDPLLTEARLKKLELLSEKDKSEVERLAFLINGLLQSFFQQLDLTLVDFKLEFGANNQGQILLSDEISPDTCRIWDNRIGDPKERILDKDRFRQDLGGVINAYGEVLKRIQGVSSKPRICS